MAVDGFLVITNQVTKKEWSPSDLNMCTYVYIYYIYIYTYKSSGDGFLVITFISRQPFHQPSFGFHLLNYHLRNCSCGCRQTQKGTFILWNHNQEKTLTTQHNNKLTKIPTTYIRPTPFQISVHPSRRRARPALEPWRWWHWWSLGAPGSLANCRKSMEWNTHGSMGRVWYRDPMDGWFLCLDDLDVA